MSYVTIGILVVLAFLVAVTFTSLEIPILQHKQAGQNIREEGPKSHMVKAGTPSMGGIAIIIAVIMGGFLGQKLGTEFYLVAAAFVLFGLVGFFDDYLKVIKKNNLGLLAWQKFGLQIIIAVAFAIAMAKTSIHGTSVFIPIIDINLDFGMWYIPFIAFVMLAMTNAVNLTDGLDGLATGVTALVALFFAFAGVTYASYPAAAFCSAMTGGCLGFLVYNKNPAKIFMGDTGSLALGGGLAAAAVAMNLEVMLLIVGLVYVIETLSVVIQVLCFKATGKRVFKMAPIHHHFEMCGMKEKTVVGMFWIFTLICCVAGIGLL
ncbi:MAG: phospho-N-acetylmuramoyl-pentapeptide-transferase [Anaerovoracaceae bacterium]